VVHRSLRSCFSDEIPDSPEDYGQQEEDNIDYDVTFEASCSSSELPLIPHGFLNDLLSDMNLSKTQAKLLVSRQ
jgi:hypothetical protein